MSGYHGPDGPTGQDAIRDSAARYPGTLVGGGESTGPRKAARALALSGMQFVELGAKAPRSRRGRSFERTLSICFKTESDEPQLLAAQKGFGRGWGLAILRPVAMLACFFTSDDPTPCPSNVFKDLMASSMGLTVVDGAWHHVAMVIRHPAWRASRVPTMGSRPRRWP